MADETELKPTPTEATPEPEAKQYSEIELRAMEQGWVPQEEWQGDQSEWRPAREFIDRGELLKSISSLKRDNLHLKQAMEEFGKHHAKVREIEYKRALNDLKLQKREALVEGDADAVIQIDERIDELKDAQRAAEEAPRGPAPQEPHPAFVAWEQRNGWYHNDRAMKLFADEIAKEVVVAGERDPSRILAEIDKQIRKEFPHKFNNPNRERAGAVEGTKQKATNRSSDHIELSDDERRIMNRIVATGAITKEQYLKEYKETLKQSRGE